MDTKRRFTPALGFDGLSDFYDLTVKLTMPEKQLRTTLVDLIAPEANERILEFGFGTGENLAYIHKRNDQARICGLDIDPKIKAIAEAKLRNKGIESELDLYDGTVFPYDTGMFDKVYSMLVFHQLDTETKMYCLKELMRVLKPEGMLIVADWGKASSALMRLSFLSVQLLDGFRTTRDNVNGRMPELIAEAGFGRVSVHSIVDTKIGTFTFYTARR